jgi:non-heme Fe2+,alpha-ketoglutarate-dependent halogenase
MTTSGLTSDQLEQFDKQGFVRGITVLTPEQATTALRKLVTMEAAEIESNAGRWSKDSYQPWQDRKNPWWHWFKPMCTHPTTLAAVRSILGPDIFIRNADIFVKSPCAPFDEGIEWHVDTVAPTEKAGKMVTAWFGLTDSNPDNGCMEWLPGSHRSALPPECQSKHSLTFREEGLRWAQNAERVSNILRAGQLSIHHFRTAHRSGENQTNKARVGLVIRFMAADTDPDAAESGKGYLASGNASDSPFSLSPTFPVTWKRTVDSSIST